MLALHQLFQPYLIEDPELMLDGQERSLYRDALEARWRRVHHRHLQLVYRLLHQLRLVQRAVVLQHHCCLPPVGVVYIKLQRQHLQEHRVAVLRIGSFDQAVVEVCVRSHRCQ